VHLLAFLSSVTHGKKLDFFLEPLDLHLEEGNPFLFAPPVPFVRRRLTMLSVVPAVQFALRDAAFNRGPSGAVKILQDALGLPADGIVGPKTKEALQGAERDPKKLLSDLRGARERYERRTRDESSKFWAGLSNRWDRQHADSLTMLA
jgi:hypothetical protein